MSIKQMIKCSVCDTQEIEEVSGMGFSGWGALQGIALDGEENPTLCPLHLGVLANVLDTLKAKGGA